MADLTLVNNKSSSKPSIPGVSGAAAYFYISIGLLFLVLVGYGGVLVLQQAERQALDELKDQIALKEQNIENELLNQFYVLDQKLGNIRDIFSGYSFATNVFQFVENTTHPDVHFTNFRFERNGLKIDMTGETKSFALLARQISLFEQDPQVERAEFGGLSFNSQGGVGFRITIILRPSILQIPS